jgi:hypothetical protein
MIVFFLDSCQVALFGGKYFLGSIRFTSKNGLIDEQKNYRRMFERVMRGGKKMQISGQFIAWKGIHEK